MVRGAVPFCWRYDDDDDDDDGDDDDDDDYGRWWLRKMMISANNTIINKHPSIHQQNCKRQMVMKTWFPFVVQSSFPFPSADASHESLKGTPPKNAFSTPPWKGLTEGLLNMVSP